MATGRNGSTLFLSQMNSGSSGLVSALVLVSILTVDDRVTRQLA